jgi:hypothetical protein
MLVIGPLTQYFLSRTFLLALSFGYALMHQAWPGVGRSVGQPDSPAILAFVVGMALATFVVRIDVPQTVSVLNMHPGDFPQYILMFAAGVVAGRAGAGQGRAADGLSRRRDLCSVRLRQMIEAALQV